MIVAVYFCPFSYVYTNRRRLHAASERLLVGERGRYRGYCVGNIKRASLTSFARHGRSVSDHFDRHMICVRRK